MDISKINYYLESFSSNGKCGEHYLGNIYFMNSSIVCYRINILFFKSDYKKILILKII